MEDLKFIHLNCYFIHCWKYFLLFGRNFHTFAYRTNPMKKFLIISTSNDLVRIAPERVVYISSTLVQADGEMRMLSFQLGQLERLIASQLGSEGDTFIRIGKSLIINRSYIYYINVAKQRLVLSDIATVNHSVSASREALKQLKELLEKEAK